MVLRRRKTARKTARKPVRRTIKKSKTRKKKGTTRTAQPTGITPAQKKKLQKTVREFEKHLNMLTRKYNQIVTALKR